MHVKRRKMYRFYRRFSLFALFVCLGMVSGASAAPSVHVLGGGTVGNTASKTNVINKGNTTSAAVLNANKGIKKSASVKTLAPKSVAAAVPISRSASNRIGMGGVKTATSATANTATGTARFPGVVTKTNIQNLNKTTSNVSTSTTPATGYNVQDMSDRLTGVEGVLQDKVDNSTLDNYYTKSEVDSRNYTKDEIDSKISAIDVSASSQFMHYMTEQVRVHGDAITGLLGSVEELQTSEHTVKDLNSGEYKNLYLVTGADFDESIFDDQE